MKEPIGPDHYRYYETVEPDGVKLACMVYTVVAETPCCWYLVQKEYARHLTEQDLDKAWLKRMRKRVLKDQSGRKKYYACREAALHSFIERKKSHLGHLRMATALAELSLATAKTLRAAKEFPIDDVNCGHNEYTESLNFCDW